MIKSVTLRHGSLFSGIGGFDLAAHWCGWQNIFHCEINTFCRRVLQYYWPKASSILNIIGYEWKKWKGKIDVLSGGWPCQRYSIAGSQKGGEPLKEEMLRAVQCIMPAWCVLENVFNFLGKNFAHEHDLLCQRLESMGYQVQTYDIDGASVGVPTLERHCWLVAASDGYRHQRGLPETLPDIPRTERPFQRNDPRMFNRWLLPGSRVCKLGERVSQKLDTTAISEKRWHSETLRAFGNAIIPQAAYRIFQCIQKGFDRR